MTSPDQFEYIKLEVLTKMDFLIKSNGRLDNLLYDISQYKPKSIRYESILNSLEKEGIISVSKEWPVAVGGDKKNIGFIFPFSIIDKKRFDKLYLSLSKKYKDYKNNNEQRISISYSPVKGIFLTSNPNACYGVSKKRKETFEIILNGNGSEIRLKTLESKTEQPDSIIVDSIKNINKLFSKKVVNTSGEKIIIREDSSGYKINIDKYIIVTDL